MGQDFSEDKGKRSTWVVIVGGGFLIFCNLSVVGSATMGVSGGAVVREGVAEG